VNWRSTVIVSILAAICLAADAPSTQPTPSQSFANLASPDADLREQAKSQLLGLQRSDLPALRELVEQNRPLAPAQMAALHDIVVHLYLSGEPYDSDPDFGFIGLRWTDMDMINDIPRLGVPVGTRLPGFPGFQLLRDGDLILGVFLQPNSPLQQWPNRYTTSIRMLQLGIEAAGNQRDIVLLVLRQGQRMRIPVRLRPKMKIPNLAAATDVETYFLQWQKKGEDYWQAQFLPLLRPGVS
jgi:hypothetical protein